MHTAYNREDMISAHTLVKISDNMTTIERKKDERDGGRECSILYLTSV